MRALRNIPGVCLMDKLGNSMIKVRYGVEKDVVTKIEKIEKSMHRRFGYAERTKEDS